MAKTGEKIAARIKEVFNAVSEMSSDKYDESTCGVLAGLSVVWRIAKGKDIGEDARMAALNALLTAKVRSSPELSMLDKLGVLESLGVRHD